MLWTKISKIQLSTGILSRDLNFLVKQSDENTSYDLPWNFLGTAQEPLWNLYRTSQELLRNFLGTSQELLRNFLGTSQELLRNCKEPLQNLSRTYQELLRNFLGILRRSQELQRNFFQASYTLLIKFLQTPNELPMNLL